MLGKTSLQHPGDVYTENVLKYIKSALKHPEKLHCPYDATKTAVRNYYTYWSYEGEPEKLWKEKFQRRLDNLKCGFFTDKSKPYETIGRLYLESGDLLLSSVREDVRSQLEDIPRFNKAELDLWNAPLAMSSKKLPKITVFPPLSNPGQHTPGVIALMDRIAEVKSLQRLVQARQSLGDFFRKLEERASEEEAKLVESMLPGRPLIDVQSSMKLEDLTSASGRSRRFRSNKSMLAKLERRYTPEGRIKVEEPEWKKELKLAHVINKLNSLHSLFCAIFNMKAKSVKSQNLLSSNRVTHLLRSKVTLDKNGRPLACKPTRQPTYHDPAVRLDGGTQDSLPNMMLAARTYSTRFGKRRVSTNPSSTNMKDQHGFKVLVR